jgi:putative restriction endonuclease
VPLDDPDFELRRAAIDRVRELSRRYDDLIPVDALRAGFAFRGARVGFGSFYSGIYRPAAMQGPAALCIVTAPPKVGKPPPYDDDVDSETGVLTYRYRDPASDSLPALRAAERDNATLVAAHEMAVPVIYFRGIAPGQYTPVAPVFITANDSVRRLVHLEAALPVQDMTSEGLVSGPNVRRYATREALVRLHQQRFRVDVLHAYRERCAVCTLREAELVQAAHIIEDRDDRGDATVVNGLALCAIHHLAYDRNLLGIDPAGNVHIARRLREKRDGPMLREGLQGFHGATIRKPRRVTEHPDPERLAIRFATFEAAA